MKGPPWKSKFQNREIEYFLTKNKANLYRNLSKDSLDFKPHLSYTEMGQKDCRNADFPERKPA